MSLPAFSIRFKTITVALVVVLMIWGSLSYMSIPRREDPEYVVRTAQILTSWPGTPTEQVEDLITAPLEEEVNTLDGIRWLRSETSVGTSAIYVELDRPTPGSEVPQMWDKVRSRMDRVAMPDASIKPILIDDFGDTNIMLLSLYQIPLPGEEEIREENRYSPRDLEIFADRLKNELKLLDGVAKVVDDGIQQEAIFVETDLETWTHLNLTTNQIQALISTRNIIAPGGSVDLDIGHMSVNPSGNFDAVEQMKSIVVGTIGEGDSRAPVYLEDLGLRIERGYEDPPTSIARYSDETGTYPTVVVAFAMKAGANIVDVCASARELVQRLKVGQKILPPDLGIGFVSDQSENVTRKIDDFVKNVLGAVIIVVVVVFLMVGFRSAMVMAANIPLVLIGSLALIPLFGVQMEQISLAAMIIALGMLVDNAVQVTDQTRRLMTEGKTAAQAARLGAEQLGFPILIATGTTIAAFFPMLLGLQGTTREYVGSLPITITIVLALSYVLAMTFCVLLASWFVKAPKHADDPLSPVALLIRKLRGKKPGAEPKAKKGGGLYEAMIRGALAWKWPVTIVSFGALAVVMMLPVRSEFFPQDIRDQFTIDIWLPEGASIHQTDEATKQVEEILVALSPHEGQERLRAMASIVGKGMPRWYLGRSPESPKRNYAEIVVRTTDGIFTGGYAEELRRIVAGGDEKLGLRPVVGARVIVRELMLGPVVDAPIGIRIFGPRLGTGFADPALMHAQADKLKAIFRGRPGTYDVYDTWGSDAFELKIDVDEDRANLAGVTNAAIARTMNAYLSGHYLTTYREADHQVPVYLRLPAAQRVDFDIVRTAYVEGHNGRVPLDAVATADARWAPAKIERRFLQRVIEVRARNEAGYSANDIVAGTLDSPEFKEWKAQLPPGFWWEVGGEMFESKQSQSELSLSLGISIIAIILLLIIQYNGIMKPIIILATLPLALIGALLGLYVTDNALGFMPSLGLLSLFGIVVNTAIIFLEFADGLIADKVKASDGSGPIMGLTREEFRGCLVEAGKVRLLPIAMTTLTTIGGLLPLALAGGPLWEGMSWLMIFGLIVATVLTLILVPSLYAIFVETFRAKPIPAPEGSDPNGV